MKLLRILSVALLTCVFGAPVVAGTDDLPDIGSPAEAAISLDDEYRFGMMVMRGLRDSEQIIEDPEVA